MTPIFSVVGPSFRARVLEHQKRKTAWVEYLAPLCYIGFLVFLFVNGKPFDTRQQNLAVSIDSGEGDPVRQIIYLSLCATSFVSVAIYGVRKSMYPFFVSLLVFYAVVSSIWAVDTSISFRRAILNVVVICGIANFVGALGPERAYILFRRTLAVIMVVSLVSVFVVPGLARHPAWEPDPGLVGAWKGVFSQKNHASAIASIAILLYCHECMNRLGAIKLFVLACSIIFLLGTKGKTSIGMLVPALMVGVSFRFLMRSEKGKIVMLIGVCAFFATIIILGGLFSAQIIAKLSDPMAFTGRVAIWQIAVRFIEGHLLLGSGYGDFWNAGPTSPVLKLSGEHWVADVLHSHNGYLEMLVFMGVPGLLIAILGVVIMPFVYLIQMPLRFAAGGAMFSSVWLYCLMHNFLEAYLLARDKQVWMCLFVAIVLMRGLSRFDLSDVPHTERRGYGNSAPF